MIIATKPPKSQWNFFCFVWLCAKTNDIQKLITPNPRQEKPICTPPPLSKCNLPGNVDFTTKPSNVKIKAELLFNKYVNQSTMLKYLAIIGTYNFPPMCDIPMLTKKEA